MCGGYYFAYRDIFPMVPTVYLSSKHKIIATILFINAILSFVIASLSDPGVITKENYDEYANLYEYDNILYDPESVCRTCGVFIFIY